MKRIAPAIGLLVGILIVLLNRWDAFSAFDRVSYRAVFDLRGAQCGSPDIVILDIDQKSIDEYGKFPWPRSRYAELVRRLSELGARVIAFSFAFTGETPDDELFAQACRDAGNVYLPVRAVRTEMGLEYVHPPAIIEDAVAGLGHISLAASEDEMVSTIALDRGSASEGYLALSALLALAKLGISQDEIMPCQGGLYRIGPLRIPTTAQNQMRINYAGDMDAFDRVSYLEMAASGWANKVHDIRDNIVLIGVTAEGHMADYRVPARVSNGRMADTSIHANALDTLLRQRFILATALPWWTLIMGLAACAYLWVLLPSRLATLSAGALLVALLVASSALFTIGAVFFDPLPAATGLIGTFALVRFGSIWQRERRLRAYAPTHLVEESQTNGAIEEGEEVLAAILFADVKSFTALAESKDPHTVYQLMRECTQILVDETHRMGGVIDKFTGDGVMAVFGLTDPRPDDAQRAVRAALNMQAALRRLNQEHHSNGDVPLELRIGINIGSVAVGSVGSDVRKDFTVLGDTVNVAARLEQTADPGTVAVSAAVFEATKGSFAFTSLGPLYLRNRAQPVLAFLAEEPADSLLS